MAVPNLWRTQKQRYSLQAEICPRCSNAVFPPRRVCPYCQRPAATAVLPESEASLFIYAPQTPAPVGSLAVSAVIAGDD